MKIFNSFDVHCKNCNSTDYKIDCDLDPDYYFDELDSYTIDLIITCNECGKCERLIFGI